MMGLRVAPPTSDDGPGYAYSRYVFVLFYIIISCGCFVARANQVNVKRLAAKEPVSIIPRDLDESGIMWKVETQSPSGMTSRLNQTSGTTWNASVWRTVATQSIDSQVF